jgi:hypothetical protein
MISCAFLACAALVQGPVVSAQGVVMISDLAGSARLGATGKALGLTQEIPAGAFLVLDKGAKVSVLNMKTGEESTFAGPGKFRFDAQGKATGLVPANQRKIQALQGVVQLRPGALAQASVVMRSAPERAEAPMSPAGPWILTPTPEFRWKSAGAKATYHFKLKDAQGQVLFELTQEECAIQVPEHMALAEEAPYTWMLETTLPDGSQTRRSGDVKVLPRAVREQIEKSRPGPDATFADKLVYAVMLEQYDLHDEAKATWQALAKAHPGDPALTKLSLD